MKKLIGAGLAAVLVLAACSSSSKSSNGGGGGSQPATRTTTGITDTEIHIGGIYHKDFYGEAEIGARARIKRENDAGGVNGRKIVLDTMLDEGGDQNKDADAAKQLVEQQKVFAVIPVFTAAFAGADYLEQQKVPFFGWAIQPVWCDKQYGFGVFGSDCEPSKLQKVADFVVNEQKLFSDGDAKGKTIALVSEDNDSAKAGLALFKSGWELHGAKVVLVDSSMPSPPAVVSDYTPFAQKILTANAGKAPDLVETVLSVSDSAGLSKKLHDLGYKGIIQGFSLYDPRLASLSKDVVNQVGFEPFEANTPPIQQMVGDLKAVKPDVALSQPAAAGYWSMDMFIQILKKAGKDLTRESFMKASDGFTYEVQGATPKISFPDGHHNGSACQSWVTGNGTGFTVTIPLTCAPLVDNPLYKK